MFSQGGATYTGLPAGGSIPGIDVLPDGSIQIDRDLRVTGTIYAPAEQIDQSVTTDFAYLAIPNSNPLDPDRVLLTVTKTDAGTAPIAAFQTQTGGFVAVTSAGDITTPGAPGGLSAGLAAAAATAGAQASAVAALEGKTQNISTASALDTTVEGRLRINDGEDPSQTRIGLYPWGLSGTGDAQVVTDGDVLCRDCTASRIVQCTGLGVTEGATMGYAAVDGELEAGSLTVTGATALKNITATRLTYNDATGSLYLVGGVQAAFFNAEKIKLPATFETTDGGPVVAQITATGVVEGTDVALPGTASLVDQLASFDTDVAALQEKTQFTSTSAGGTDIGAGGFRVTDDHLYLGNTGAEVNLTTGAFACGSVNATDLALPATTSLVTKLAAVDTSITTLQQAQTAAAAAFALAVPSANTYACNAQIAGQDIQNRLALVSNNAAFLLSTGEHSVSGNTAVTVTSKSSVVICGQYSAAASPATILKSRAMNMSGCTRVRLANMAIDGLVTATNSNILCADRVVFGGGLTLAAATAGFYIFEDCTFSAAVTIPASLSVAIFFSRCNFSGIAIVNGAVAPLVYLTDCYGLYSFSQANTVINGRAGLANGYVRSTQDEIYSGGAALNGVPSGSAAGLYLAGANGSATGTWSNLNTAVAATAAVQAKASLTGANFSGNVQAGGGINLAGQKITSLAAGTNGGDAVNATQLALMLPTAGGTITGDLVVQGNLTTQGSTITANSVVQTFDRMSITQSPADANPALLVTQGGGSGDIFRVVDSDGASTIFRLGQNCDLDLNGAFTVDSATGDLEAGTGTFNGSGVSIPSGSLDVGGPIIAGDAVRLHSVADPLPGAATVGDLLYSTGASPGVKVWTGAWSSVGGGLNPTVTSLATGDALYYTGSAWVNGYYTAPPAAGPTYNGAATLTMGGTMVSPHSWNASSTFVPDIRVYSDSGCTTEVAAYSPGSTASFWTFTMPGNLAYSTAYWAKARWRPAGYSNAWSAFSAATSFTTSAADIVTSSLTTSAAAYTAAAAGALVLITQTEFNTIAAKVTSPIQLGFTAAGQGTNGSYNGGLGGMADNVSYNLAGSGYQLLYRWTASGVGSTMYLVVGSNNGVAPSSFTWTTLSAPALGAVHAGSEYFAVAKAVSQLTAIAGNNYLYMLCTDATGFPCRLVNTGSTLYSAQPPGGWSPTAPQAFNLTNAWNQAQTCMQVTFTRTKGWA